MDAKAILLIDNCSAHSPIELLQTTDKKIVAMFLPPNVTAVVQPMDQNPIRITKLKYRSLLVSKILANQNMEIHDLLKQHSIRDAILLLELAWKELPQSVLKNAWSRIFNWDDDQFDAEDDVPIAQLLASDSEYQSLADETYQLLLSIAPNSGLNRNDCDEWNDDQLVEGEIETESDESEIEREVESIAYHDAINSVNTLIKWCEENNQQGTKHLTGLLALRSDIVTKHFAQPKIQKRVTDFFQTTESQ